MRYFLIDKIDRLKLNTEIVATKCVALSEDVFADHFFGSPVLPGALQLEMLAQAGTALLEYSSGFSKKALLVLAERIKFRRLVRPGEKLSIELHVQSRDDDSARLEGTIRSGMDPVAEGSIVFVLKPADDFYPEHLRHLVKSIYDIWLREAVIER